MLDSEKERKWSSPRGAGYAIRSRRRMFREGRQWSTWLRFGLQFRSILGAQVATILLFGRPGVQIGGPEACLNFVVILRPRKITKWSKNGGNERGGPPLSWLSFSPSRTLPLSSFPKGNPRLPPAAGALSGIYASPHQHSVCISLHSAP